MSDPKTVPVVEGPALLLINLGTTTLNPSAKFPDGETHELHINPKGRVTLPSGSTVLTQDPNLVVRNLTA